MLIESSESEECASENKYWNPKKLRFRYGLSAKGQGCAFDPNFNNEVCIYQCVWGRLTAYWKWEHSVLFLPDKPSLVFKYGRLASPFPIPKEATGHSSPQQHHGNIFSNYEVSGWSKNEHIVPSKDVSWHLTSTDILCQIILILIESHESGSIHW